ncbi:hypothetical protein [Streptomyces spectabilis]|uniref:Uncharacterized protein n=1 Tax=Streptomyces spectabilis TaxID=68270 RepID=A0A5P2X5U4_STRST|nr:hypothetical protein [Streptomyces spectabilis]MBB5108395.1 hypothetical protein [Streptomyces spectabilis]MCI3901149.1 hypothetical protein [Streptomyces spectabilis]QEV58639.1 hypothetical protein CP982_07815 [Streptomyces spectabilis]GGV46258.1 hypothetical protein GCM10010245_72580 [Streptomyces spectabilis]
MTSPEAAPSLPADQDGAAAEESAPGTTETMMRRDGFLPPDEAAEDLGCGKRWLLNGLNRHGFPHTRMGRAKWLSPEDRAEIRQLCRVPAEPAKIARLRKSQAKRKPAKSAA